MCANEKVSQLHAEIARNFLNLLISLNNRSANGKRSGGSAFFFLFFFECVLLAVFFARTLLAVFFARTSRFCILLGARLVCRMDLAGRHQVNSALMSAK
jgi:hypothetical protein